MNEYYDFLAKLKKKYKNGYLALATEEERGKFFRLFFENGSLSEEDARTLFNKILAIQENAVFLKPYNDYVKYLENKYGKYYFSLMSENEKNKLLKLYAKYMQNKYKNYTLSDAFLELFYDEYVKYQNDKEMAKSALARMDAMVDNQQISIDDLGIGKK